MRKFIVFKDGDRRELSPITYEEFELTQIWEGNSDVAYNEYLRDNGWVDLSIFNEEAMKDAVVVLEGFPQWRLWSGEADSLT